MRDFGAVWLLCRKTAIRSLLLTLLLLSGYACKLSAQLIRGGHFERISSLNDINDQGFYLICASYNGKGYLLTNNLTENKKKFTSKTISVETEQLKVSDLSCLWRIKDDGTGAKLLISLENGHAVCNVRKNDVALVDSSSIKAVHFNISKEDTLYHFAIKEDSRALCLSTGYDYFGFFVSGAGSLDCSIYKYVGDEVQFSDLTDLPSKPFAFCWDSLAVQWSSEGTFVDVSGYKLTDGTLATDAPSSVFQIKSDKDKIFASLPDSGQWKLIDDVPIYKVGEEYYALCWIQGPDVIIKPMNIHQINGLSVSPLSLRYYAEAPQSEVTEQATMVLKGGWSRSALQNLELTEKVRSVDLTQTELPCRFPLLHWTEHPNVAIYMNACDTACVNKAQKAVVACNAEGNELIRPFTLQDKQPFAFDRDFLVRASQMSYVRQSPDKNWQTLYLPFSVSKPTSLELRQFKEMENGEVLFVYGSQIEAYSPSLFRSSAKTLTFSCDGQMIKSTPSMATGSFIGVSENRSVTNMYALSSDGSSFVRCLDGSYISPFRCYLLLDNAENEVKIISGIKSVSISSKDNSEFKFDLQGRRVQQPTANQLIIQGGKKIKTK